MIFVWSLVTHWWFYIAKLPWEVFQGHGQLRATFHTRTRALDHCTSSTLIGGKGGAGPSSLHTMFERPTVYIFVNARWQMSSLHGFLHGIEWIMFHGHMDYSQKPSLGSRPNRETMALRMLTTVDLFYFIMCEDPHE